MTDVILVVARDVINSSTGGGERVDCVLLRKTGELFLVMNRNILKQWRGLGKSRLCIGA